MDLNDVETLALELFVMFLMPYHVRRLEHKQLISWMLCMQRILMFIWFYFLEWYNVSLTILSQGLYFMFLEFILKFREHPNGFLLWRSITREKSEGCWGFQSLSLNNQAFFKMELVLYMWKRYNLEETYGWQLWGKGKRKGVVFLWVILWKSIRKECDISCFRVWFSMGNEKVEILEG